MKILRIIVDEIPNEKEYCKFCTILDDTKEHFCTITEQKCGSRCCLIALNEVEKEIGKATIKAIKPAVDSMREIIEEYDALNEEIGNADKEDNS